MPFMHANLSSSATNSRSDLEYYADAAELVNALVHRYRGVDKKSASNGHLGNIGVGRDEHEWLLVENDAM